MKNSGIYFFLALTCSNAFASSHLTISYRDLESTILSQNRSVASLEKVYEAEQARRPNFEESFQPKLAFESGLKHAKEANGSGDTSPYWKLNFESNVYRGGRDIHSSRIHESQVLMKKIDIQARLQQELFEARQYYVQLFYVQKKRRFIEGSLDDFDQMIRSVSQRISAGILSQSAKKSFDNRIDQRRRDLLILQGREEELEDLLLLSLGVKSHQEIELDKELQIQDIGKKEENELVTPEIHKIDALTSKWQLSRDFSQRKLRPNVDLFASYSDFLISDSEKEASLPTREFDLGVRLSFDLGAKHLERREALSSSIEISALDEQKAYLKNQILHQLHEYERDILIQNKLSDSLQQSVKQSRKYFEAMKRDYDRGIGSHLELVDLLQSIYQNQLDLLDAEAKIASAKVARASIVMGVENLR